MDEAIERVGAIVERKGECLLGGIMRQILRCDMGELANELSRRGYVVRQGTRGYVVYPKRKRTAGPSVIIEVI